MLQSRGPCAEGERCGRGSPDGLSGRCPPGGVPQAQAGRRGLVRLLPGNITAPCSPSPAGQDYDTRLAQKKWAMNSGMLAEEGSWSAWGDRGRSSKIGPDHGRAGRPAGEGDEVRSQSNTPLAERDHALFRDELTAIAIMRLMYPDRLIPASLDVEDRRPTVQAGGGGQCHHFDNTSQPRSGRGGAA